MKSFASFLLLAGGALAHLQMQDPLPIKSPLNPAVPNDSKDYDYTAPLIGNGLPYPCKGYLSADASLRTPQKSWSAGSTQTFTIAPPGAVHGGGSCQLSMSYDMGQTWNVIFSYIGGCMAEDLTQSFGIPKEAPGGQAVFAWSWFNRLGNREMYHNCAIVTITNGGSGLNSRDHPAPFVANAGPVNSCSTVENQDPVFPDPGASVKYSGEYRGTTPASGRGITGSNCAHPGGANGAGTRGNAVEDAKHLAASPSSSTSTVASTSTVEPISPPSSSPTTTFIASTPSIAAPAATSPSTTSVSTTSTSAAASPTLTQARVCRRRKTKAIAKSVIPSPAGEVRSHLVRRSRHFGIRANSHAELARRMRSPVEERSGRIAAMKAERPVYTD